MIKTKTTTIAQVDQDRNISHQYVCLYQEFARNGNLIHEIVFDPAGEVERKTLFSYNEDGKLIEKVNFEKGDQLIERTDYFFDDKGNLIQTEVTGSDGSKTIKEYHFDPVEKIEQAILNSDNGEIEGYEVFWYGGKDEIIVEVKSDTNNRIEYKRFATYNGAGRLVMEEIFGYDEVFERKVVYSYLSNGKLAQMVTQDTQGSTSINEKFTYDCHDRLTDKTSIDQRQGIETHSRYEYDLKGNQILHETYENGRLVLSNVARYDAHDHLIEEEITTIGSQYFCVIKKHDIEYWQC